MATKAKDQAGIRVEPTGDRAFNIFFEGRVTPDTGKPDPITVGSEDGDAQTAIDRAMELRRLELEEAGEEVEEMPRVFVQKPGDIVIHVDTATATVKAHKPGKAE